MFLEARNKTDMRIMSELNEHAIIKQNVVFKIVSVGQEPSFSLREIIFMDKTPLDYLLERAKPYRNPMFVVHLQGESEERFSSEHRIHKISLDILKEVRENPLIQKYRRERESLIKECNSLLGEIEEKFVL